MGVSNQRKVEKYPIIAHDQSNGKIKITAYSNASLATPLVEEIRVAELSGSTCVVTTTNAEAAQVNGLLRKYGYPSKLIQSNDGFQLTNLKELRFFSNIVNTQQDSPVIMQEEWDEAKVKLAKEFEKSSNLPACMSTIKAFELVNPTKKYKSDWKTFLSESKMEDFLRIKGDSIYVSTIHKSKGKEFDNVFILLNKFDPHSEECKRQLYVAMTRAKNRLSIHYTGNYLSGLTVNDMTQRIDLVKYPPAQQISIALTMKDVNLGYFDSIQSRVNSLFSGDALNVNSDGMFTSSGPVLRFSNAFRQALALQKVKGYVLKSAKINDIVYWFNQTTQREVTVILPELTLELNQS
jgi:ATP-dependent DNA helicase RecQ